MKKYYWISARVLAVTLILLCSSVVYAGTNNFNNPVFTPWDVEKASNSVEQREKKPYTIMIYMNGSDLESESGAATDDLIELLGSGIDSHNANIVLFTGGANRWQNKVIPANECVIWEAEDGWLYELTGVGLVNMGDPGTLSSFIQFGMQNFPADKYGLIMWDHGGGSIVGYGHDEKFADGSLTLLEMGYAFEKAGLRENKLEFLGFDSCLMATVEMAVVASDYARYLIASEDLEPSGGWDYSFLRVFNQNPQADGQAVGVAIIDTFMQYYGAYSDEILTLSVIDLSQANRVMTAMGRLMERCSDLLTTNRISSFRTLAGKRSRTKTFGEGTPRDNECDMVDIGDMAMKLSDLYPDESREVLTALEEAVKYNRHNSNNDLKGLSSYYIYGGKAVGQPALNTYASLNMDTGYTQYLNDFFSLLVNNTRGNTNNTRGNTSSSAAEPDEIAEWALAMWQPVKEKPGYYLMSGLMENADSQDAAVLWPCIEGQYVCLNSINQTEYNHLYAAPAVVNGRDCDIIVLFNEFNPNGKIMGVRNNEGIVIQKGYDPIEPGDAISLYYCEQALNHQSAAKAEWCKGRVFTVGNQGLTLDWVAAPEGSVYNYQMKDILDNTYFTEPFTMESAAFVFKAKNAA